MRVLVAPAPFKGSLTASEAAAAMARGVRRARPGMEVVELPLADGGAGTVDALVRATGGGFFAAHVTGPLGTIVRARWGSLGFNGMRPSYDDAIPAGNAASGAEAGDDGGIRSAVVELAGAAGLDLVPEADRSPLLATTYGVGELIRLALDHLLGGSKADTPSRGQRERSREPSQGGPDRPHRPDRPDRDDRPDADHLRRPRLLIGLGDSATVEMGAGLAQALGVRFLDRRGRLFDRPLRAGDLLGVEKIDLRGRHPGLTQVDLQVLCDVDNPLLGRRGSARTFALQKGARPEQIPELEAGLAHFVGLVESTTGRRVRDLAGAGAAGGAGAGIAGLLYGRLLPGAEQILDACAFDHHARQADLVVTGEGRLDEQSLSGKVVASVSRRALAIGVPVVAVAGEITLDMVQLQSLGIVATGTVSRSSESSAWQIPTDHAAGRPAFEATCGEQALRLEDATEAAIRSTLKA